MINLATCVGVYWNSNPVRDLTTTILLVLVLDDTFQLFNKSARDLKEKICKKLCKCDDSTVGHYEYNE